MNIVETVCVVVAQVSTSRDEKHVFDTHDHCNKGQMQTRMPRSRDTSFQDAHIRSHLNRNQSQMTEVEHIHIRQARTAKGGRGE